MRCEVEHMIKYAQSNVLCMYGILERNHSEAIPPSLSGSAWQQCWGKTVRVKSSLSLKLTRTGIWSSSEQEINTAESLTARYITTVWKMNTVIHKKRGRLIRKQQCSSVFWITARRLLAGSVDSLCTSLKLTGAQKLVRKVARHLEVCLRRTKVYFLVKSADDWHKNLTMICVTE